MHNKAAIFSAARLCFQARYVASSVQSGHMTREILCCRILKSELVTELKR